MLLSRVAERIYWLARYLERAQNTARLVTVHSHVMLDLPFGTNPDWDTLLEITSSKQHFLLRYRNINERNVVKFMLADMDNPDSIMHSLHCARENIRTTRDILPFVVWEEVNELFLYSSDNIAVSIARSPRFQLLQTIRRSCQRIAGLLDRNLDRDDAYRFLKLGGYIERADITTRVLDVAATTLLDRDPSSPVINELLWMSVLKTLHGLTMYRRHYGPGIAAGDVLRLALTAPRFPCSAAFAVTEMIQLLQPLKNSSAVQSQCRALLQKLETTDYDTLADGRADGAKLHEFLDQVQIELTELHERVAQTWFTHNA